MKTFFSFFFFPGTKRNLWLISSNRFEVNPFRQEYVVYTPLRTGGQSPPTPSNLPKMQEWPLLPISEVMTTPNWQDGHMLWWGSCAS
jgi:hypothetical protein